MGIQALDIRLFLLINHGTANEFFDILMPLLSKRGYLLVLPFLAYLFYRGSKGKNPAGGSYLAAALWAFLISVCTTLFAEFMEHVLKHAIGRPRPCDVIEGVRLLVPCPTSPSMPSGHAFSSFAFAAPLFYLTRKYIRIAARIYPLALAALIAYSRPYVGVHYPSDIAVGALLGALIAMAFSVLYEHIRREKTAA